MSANYLFVVSMDVDPDKEDLFNEVYDPEHVPLLLEVPGVVGVTRYTTEPFEVSIGGERQSVDSAGYARYTAIYELESAEVLVSDGWAAAVEKGRWPGEVRPFTKNRSHVLKKAMG